MGATRGRVAVALSGGLDSAAAAALLKDQGYEVLGVHLRLMNGPPLDSLEALARALDIPLEVLDLSPEFEAEVVRYFTAEYGRGRTPNPCVRCNAAIKFGALWDRLQAEGIPYLATGHYVRPGLDDAGDPALYRGADRGKDQSYFLQRLPRGLLPHLLFPLGGLTKARVRELMHGMFPTRPHNCQESQEICFIPEGGYRDFLQRHGAAASPGDVVDRRGRVLGRHRGLVGYTVGQRRGLAIPAPEPYYVLELQPEVNRLVIGPKAELFSAGLVASEANWLIQPPTGELTATAVIRYRHPGVAARIRPVEKDRLEVSFAAPQAAVAPGQAVAFYHDDRLLGGAWIEARIE